MKEVFNKCKNYLLVIIFAFILLVPTLIHADSGFDSSYSSGGSSSSSSSSSSSYDGDGGGEFDLPTFLSMLYAFGGVVVFILSCSKFFKIENNDYDFPLWYSILFWILYVASIYFIFGVEIFYMHYAFVAFIFFFVLGNERFTTIYDTFKIRYMLAYWSLFFLSILVISGFGAFIVSLFLGVPMLIIGIISTLKTRSQGKKELKSVTVMKDETIHKRLGEDFDIEAFKKEAFESYKAIQIAWMERDIEPVRHLLSDQMCSMYKTQLATLIAKNQKNMMEDIEFVKCEISRVVKTAKKIEIEVLLQVTCRDYIVDKNNKVIRGNKRAINEYFYKLVFVKSIEPSKLKVCPNCGAKLENAASDKCEYCNTIIVKESTNFAMTDKKMLKQSIINYK